MRLLALAALGLVSWPASGRLPAARLPSPGPTAEIENIEANANRRPAGRLSGGVLTLRLDARLGRWFPEADGGPSEVVQAFGEEGGALQIPGPLVRVPAGTSIRLFIRNRLDSVLVIHGLYSRPGSEGDSLVISPGSVREVRFDAGAPGTYHYWGSTTGSGIETREWLDSQLSGAFIVDPPGPPAVDRIFVMGLWFKTLSDSTGPGARQYEELMVINGKMWPHTERFTYSVGDSVRWRWINPTGSSHPMHLHGFYYNIESLGDGAGDSALAPGERPFVNTRLMLPGATMATAWQAQREGNWVFHCHFAFHVSHFLAMTPPDTAHGEHREHRMSGLVLGIHVNPGPRAEPAVTAPVARRLRLLMQEAPKRHDSMPGFGFVLQDPRSAVRDTVPTDSLPVAGPTIVLTRGEPVAITVVNRLRQQTGVHWHGIELESFPDGVPGWSGTPGRIMPPIAPADSFVAEFVPPRAGTFLYHSHSNEDSQISSGLYGALIVLEPGQALDPATDLVFLLGAGRPFPNTGLLNGEAEPGPIDLVAGRTYRFRFIHIQPDWRVHITLFDDRGITQWLPVAKDGADLSPARRRMTPARLLAGPGETADFEFTPSAPGPLRLEITTWGTGWHLLQNLRVRPGATGYVPGSTREN